MKTIKKNVYYCDHCKKRSLSASAMNKHENRCTANPDRECGICNVLEGSSRNIGEIVEALKLRFSIEEYSAEAMETLSYGHGFTHYVEWKGEPITIDEVKLLADGCPNCILAILRQSKLNYKCCGIEFDYKKEFDLAMRDVNDSKRQEQYLY